MGKISSNKSIDFDPFISINSVSFDFNIVTNISGLSYQNI